MRNSGVGVDKVELSHCLDDAGGEGGRQAAELAWVSALLNGENSAVSSHGSSRTGGVEGRGSFGSEHVLFEVGQGIQVDRSSRHLEVQVLALQGSGWGNRGRGRSTVS